MSRSTGFAGCCLLLLALTWVAVAPASAEVASQPGAVAAGQLDAGDFHSCAVIPGGAVRCWGQNLNGKLGYLSSVGNVGDDETPASVGPVNIGAGRTAKQVGAGEGTTCALLDNATIRCWGAGGNGRLGYGNTTDIGDNESPASAGPVDLGAVDTAKAISVGNQSVCAIRSDDKLLCWGQAGDGALGYGNENNIGDDETPGSVGPIDFGATDTVKAVSAGGEFTCAILTSGAVSCWGLNTNFQLGLNRTDLALGDEPGETPATIGTLDLGGRTATAIAAGSKHACAIVAGGAVVCWGWGFQGRLGYGDQNDIGDNESPGLMSVDLGEASPGVPHTAKAITAGAGHTCAILENNSIRCWGGGFAGRTGHGSLDDIGDGPGEMPGPVVQIGGGATAISAGNFHVCARRADGAVLCWGKDEFGYLGDGNPVVENIGDNEAANANGPVQLGSVSPPPPPPPPPPADADKDGKPDSSDACPRVAGTTANGCPNVARSLTLAYGRGAYRGTLSSAKAACAANQVVSVFKKVGAIGGGDDRLKGTDATDAQGRYAVAKKKRRGTYYASVPKRTIATAGNCAAAISPALKIK